MRGGAAADVDVDGADRKATRDWSGAGARAVHNALRQAVFVLLVRESLCSRGGLARAAEQVLLVRAADGRDRRRPLCSVTDDHWLTIPIDT